jgi:hypothetical protein
MKTVLVGPDVCRPAYVDVKIRNVLELPRAISRLT